MAPPRAAAVGRHVVEGRGSGGAAGAAVAHAVGPRHKRAATPKPLGYPPSVDCNALAGDAHIHPRDAIMMTRYVTVTLTWPHDAGRTSSWEKVVRGGNYTGKAVLLLP